MPLFFAIPLLSPSLILTNSSSAIRSYILFLQNKNILVPFIPLDFLNSIEGTPLEQKNELTANDCLRALAMFRFVNPDRELRISGGREIHLRSLQPMGLYVANSLFVGDYLTTKGQAPQADYDMIRDLGFEVSKEV